MKYVVGFLVSIPLFFIQSVITGPSVRAQIERTLPIEMQIINSLKGANDNIMNVKVEKYGKLKLRPD